MCSGSLTCLRELYTAKPLQEQSRAVQTFVFTLKSVLTHTEGSGVTSSDQTASACHLGTLAGQPNCYGQTVRMAYLTAVNNENKHKNIIENCTGARAMRFTENACNTFWNTSESSTVHD
jgi:hypothetical protein